MKDPFIKMLDFGRGRNIAAAVVSILSAKQPATCALFKDRFFDFTERAPGLTFNKRCELITAEFVDERYNKIKKAIEDDKPDSFYISMFMNWFYDKTRYENRRNKTSVEIDESTIKEIEQMLINVPADIYYIRIMERLQHYVQNGTFKERILARLVIDDQAFTVHQACDILGVTLNWVYKTRKDFIERVRMEAESFGQGEQKE